MVIKKIGYSFLLVLLLICASYTSVEASAPNVKDCIETGENCTEDSSDNKNGEEKVEVGAVSNGSLILDIGKMILALLFVLGLIYALLKFLNKKNNMQRQQALQNLGGLSVGQNKSIQVIKIGNAYFLIGVGDNVDLLKEIKDEELIQSLTDETRGREQHQLSDIVSKWMTKKSSDTKGSQEKEDQQFKNLFSKELNDLKENRKQLLKQQTKRKDSHE